MKIASNQEINKAKEYLNNDDVELAIKELRKLYTKYPNDSLVLYELGSVLLRQGTKVREALFLLKQAINSKNKYAINNEIGLYHLNHMEFDEAKQKFSILVNSGNQIYKCYGLHGLIKTYIHTEEYAKGLNCFNELCKICDEAKYEISHLSNLKFLLLYKNGLVKNEDLANNYYRKQLVNYSKDAALEHISEHLKTIDHEDIKAKRFHSVFTEKINIVDLYDICYGLIQNQKPISCSLVDFYKCKLEEVVGSTYNFQETTYVEVIAFPNTKEILSIYPIYDKHVTKVINEKIEERKAFAKKKKVKKYKNKKKNQ